MWVGFFDFFFIPILSSEQKKGLIPVLTGVRSDLKNQFCRSQDRGSSAKKLSQAAPTGVTMVKSSKATKKFAKNQLANAIKLRKDRKEQRKLSERIERKQAKRKREGR